MESQNYYELLGVSKTASFEQINSAKNALAKKYHPDANIRNGIDTTEKMQEILEAHRVLSNPKHRADYDRTLAGKASVLQTFDLRENPTDDPEDSFVMLWKSAGALYDIIKLSAQLHRSKSNASLLNRLAMDALEHILILKHAQIPPRYWHPDTMNWLLFTWYSHRTCSIPYLLEMYDDYLRKNYGKVGLLRMENKISSYQRSVKKLLRH